MYSREITRSGLPEVKPRIPSSYRKLGRHNRVTETRVRKKNDIGNEKWYFHPPPTLPKGRGEEIGEALDWFVPPLQGRVREGKR